MRLQTHYGVAVGSALWSIVGLVPWDATGALWAAWLLGELWLMVGDRRRKRAKITPNPNRSVDGRWR